MKTKPTYQQLEKEVEILQQKLVLSKSEDKFNSFFENNKAIMLQLDTETKQIINANSSAIAFYGYTKEILLQKTINDLNTLAPDEITKLMQKAVKNKSNFFQFKHKLANDEIRDVDVYSSAFKVAGKMHMYITILDITQQKEQEKSIKQRDTYITALNHATSLLLQDNLIPYQKFTEIIGKAANASRTYIFKNNKDEKGNILMSQIAEYCAKGVNSQINNPKLQNLSFANYGRMKQFLSKGKIYKEKVSNLPEKERELLEPQDIKTILIIPIIIDKKFWGFIGFDNCLTEQGWTLTEQNYLETAAKNLEQEIKRYNTQKLLQAENERFHKTMDTMDAIVYVADIETYELLYLNKLGRELTGQGIEKKCYTALQKGQTKPCSFCTNSFLTDKHGNPNEPYVWEFQNSKTKKWYQCRDQAIKWIDGRLVRIEVATDITERINTEQALKQSEHNHKLLAQQYQLMSDNIPDLVWAKDLQGKFTFVNKANCEKLLIAKNTQEPIGKIDMFFVMRQRNLYPERNDWHTFGELCINSDKVVLKTKKPQRFDEYGYVNGEFLFLDVYKAPIFDNNGKMIGTVGHGRIVTQEKENEKKRKESEILLKRSKEQLKKINSRLKELVYKEVNKSREKDRMMLVQAKQAAMGEMIGSIAHQWRQPLNEIGLYVQNLQNRFEQNKLTSENLKQTIEKTMLKLEYLSQTVDDFRNFFRSDKEKRMFSITESIRKTLSLTEASFKNNFINIDVNLQENINIIGYSNEFSQAVLNILNNAKDVLIQRKIENPNVKVKLVKIDKKIVLTIADNAGGIFQEIIDKVFEPYFTTKGKTTGTGLGLYISKTIIERNMLGKLSVKNIKNGAEFIVEFKTDS